MEFTVIDDFGKPFLSNFSLSVKDAAGDIEYNHNIMTNMLLTSELKGYIHNPSYYFESDDQIHRQALDLLLMIQGWRRYSWKQITGVETLDLKYTPEQGIEINGQVNSFVRRIPKPNVDVSLFISKVKTDDDPDETLPIIGTCITDSLGRFRLTTDLYDKWNMVFGVKEKGKKKDYNVILDRIFRPSCRKYSFQEMKFTPLLLNAEHTNQHQDKDMEELFAVVSEDSITKGLNQKVHHLKEVTVSAKKNSKQEQIERDKAKSYAYYDVSSELDDITDNGGYVGNDLNEFLRTINDKFYIMGGNIRYKNRRPLIVINYKRTTFEDEMYIDILRLNAIKSIYISESLSSMIDYADPQISPLYIDTIYSCVVFIETYPEGKIPVDPARGVRKTKLNGYDVHREFYSPDYSILPPEPDYRRTLYWNPSVALDKDGKAKIQFYNSSTCRQFSISAETVTPQGIFGVYKQEKSE